MLYRKAKEEISEWIKNGRKALLVDGARQVGKTFLIDTCLEESGLPYIKIDLIRDEKEKSIISKAVKEGVNAILEALSLLMPSSKKDAMPIFFMDEIQECPEFITMAKYLVQEGSYRYIFSGSLLGIALTHIRSLPVGFMSVLTMYPLDFNEFMVNAGYNEISIKAIEEALEKQIPVNDYLHQKTMELFKRYLLVGGMPEAVSEYLSSHNVRNVKEIQKGIIDLYKGDFAKRKKGNPLILERIYDLIPHRLEEQNRRFVHADLEEGSEYKDHEDDFYWLYKAGAVIPVYNVSSPSLPYEISLSNKLVKLFYNDVGLLTSRYGDGFALSLLHDEDANLGGIYENFVASELLSSSNSLPYYFKARKIGELDFLCFHRGEKVAIEVKSGKYSHNHKALSNMMAVPNYNLNKAFVLCNGNVEKLDKVTYLPIYMAGLIH